MAWVRGVYGAVERRLAAPAVVGRLGLVLDTELGFWGHGRTDDDGRRNRAPPLKPPLFFEQETATELGFRFPFFAVPIMLIMACEIAFSGKTLTIIVL